MTNTAVALSAVDQLLASQSPAELAEEVLRLRARCQQAKEDCDNTKDMMTAWFDQRRLDEAELTPLFLDAAGGYLRRCRSGGMPRKQSDRVEAAFREFARLYLVSAMEPVLRKLRETAHSPEVPSPPGLPTPD